MPEKHTIQLPGYTIKRALGEGGMATVYEGWQQSLSRPVAIKVLDARLVKDPVVQAQFKQESRLVARLNHPNIIQVIDQGVANNGQPWFVMQYVKSIPLNAILHRDDVSLVRKLDIVTQICLALSYAHRNNVVHRDIKPANVLVDYEGHVRVVDFGISGYFAQSGNGKGQDVIMGTPGYMAPEQSDPAQETTYLSDIYALGVLMYELITGDKSVDSSRDASVPAPIMKIIRDCLQEDMSLRPQSADELRQRILRILQGKHLQAPKWDSDKQRDDIPTDYKLLDVLKENHYGATYLVSESRRQQLLVVKKQQVAYMGAAYTTTSALSGKSHPHIATVYGTARNERVFIAVTEYVSGGSLADRLAQAFKLEEWLLLAQQACRALQYIHELGLVHGNLRPSNILVVSPSHIKLTDFGFHDHSIGEGVDWYQPFDDEKTIASDIYSLAAVLFHVLTGEVLDHHDAGINNIDALKVLPKPLETVLRKMLMLKPAKRYQSAEQVRKALEQFSDSEKTQVVTIDTNNQATVEKDPRVLRMAKVVFALILLFFIAEAIWLFGGDGIQQFLP